MFRQPERGQAILAETTDDLEATDVAVNGLPGLRDRYRINAAYLLLDALGRAPRPAGEQTRSGPSPESLRTLICRLDPGCAFAESAYLSGPDRAEEENP